jgi:hypothetical protein
VIRIGYPLLGIRILCSRYELATAFAVLTCLAQHNDYLSVPRMPRPLLDYLMEKDYDRSIYETTRKIFIDVSVKNVIYAYGMVSENMKMYCILNGLIAS